jgi:hypothetical protein
MTADTLDNQCSDCHQQMTPEEYEGRHTHHDHGCCQEVPEPRKEGEPGCLGNTTHASCCPVCSLRPPRELYRGLRGHRFYPTADELWDVPRLYKTESVPVAEKVIHLHFFIFGCDWWLVEYDPDQYLGFGYVCLGDAHNAEWGYVSLGELEAVSVNGFTVERDLYWTPKAAKEVRLPGRWL